MKKVPIFTITAILSLMFGITACGEKVSNNLGGATRGNNAYDYNYDYSGMRTDGENMLNRFGINNTNGAGYWDYYGITNGSANDSMRNDIADTNNYNNYNEQEAQPDPTPSYQYDAPANNDQPAQSHQDTKNPFDEDEDGYGSNPFG